MRYSYGRHMALCRKVNAAWDAERDKNVGRCGYTQWAARINWCVKHQVITAQEANMLMKYDGGWSNRVNAGKKAKRDYHRAVRRVWKQDPFADYDGRVRDKAICRTSSEVKYRGD